VGWLASHLFHFITEKEITWFSAKLLLQAMRPLISPAMNKRLDIFNSMLSIVENEGNRVS